MAEWVKLLVRPWEIIKYTNHATNLDTAPRLYHGSTRGCQRSDPDPNPPITQPGGMGRFLDGLGVGSLTGLCG
jgi:hypothetical protein